MIDGRDLHGRLMGRELFPRGTSHTVCEPVPAIFIGTISWRFYCHRTDDEIVEVYQRIFSCEHLLKINGNLSLKEILKGVLLKRWAKISNRGHLMFDILASVLLCFATIQYMIEDGKKIDLYSIAIAIIVPLTILGFLSYQNIKAYNRLEKILNS